MLLSRDGHRRRFFVSGTIWEQKQDLVRNIKITRYNDTHRFPSCVRIAEGKSPRDGQGLVSFICFSFNHLLWVCGKNFRDGQDWFSPAHQHEAPDTHSFHFLDPLNVNLNLNRKAWDWMANMKKACKVEQVARPWLQAGELWNARWLANGNNNHLLNYYRFISALKVVSCYITRRQR